jgi:fluoride exporter
MLVAGIIVAGALGAWARYELSGWIQKHGATTLPLGTAVVNMIGTAVFAGLVAAQHAGVLTSGWVAVLGTGFAGAFTTFSTWMVESFLLAGQGGRVGLRAAAVNLGGQLLAGSIVAGVILALA